MKKIQFTDRNGSFTLQNPERYSYLYFPLASEVGIKNVVTPRLGGDAKLDQNTFLLEPVSSENLHNNKNTRNFWCNIEGRGCFSAAGASARELAAAFDDKSTEKADSSVVAGFMWHVLTRESAKYGVRTEVTSFVPVDANVEIMQVEITNITDKELTLTPTGIIPIYGRSADNLRDHRHVTSLLHRIRTTKYGVQVKPTLSFDERGHQLNQMTYFVCGMDGAGNAPVDFYPTVDYIVENGGSFEWPYAVVTDQKGVTAGSELEGCEAVGGMHFEKTVLAAGEKTSYTLLLGITKEEQDISAYLERFDSKEKVLKELETVKEYWAEKVNVSYTTGDKDFDRFMKWVSFQPILRRIFGCSFLPHHDYGKGGRGWRDLWQDCLALLIMNPEGVRQMLIDNFAGVRMDGSNATIIGSRQGEFVADRNNITRVWMDHGVWPCMTTKLYIDQTGDIELLEIPVSYFKDKQICRGTKTDTEWNDAYGCWQKTEDGKEYQGTILEHILVQNLTAFYEVGEHNIMRLRGADWNDALDMAPERGESVAFTNAYAGNLKDIAELLLAYEKKTGKTKVELSADLLLLLEDEEAVYNSIEKKTAVLQAYEDTCCHNITGRKEEVAIRQLADNLLHKADWIMKHIRENEWVQDSEGNGWFNGYYDNNGRRVEGEFENGVRMMLTGQVFSIMSGTASDEQIREIIKSADKYLYQEEVGGYRLNTNFHELKTDLGRMFGFSYGDKENGAVFSHMSVMYANALYKQGFVEAGFRSLDALEKQSMNFERSRIYPGIPEYFDAKGRGMYHYLTGSASWFMLTVITQMYGVRGSLGNLVLEPKLLAKQFDENGEAALELLFGGKKWKIMYVNPTGKSYGEYQVNKVLLDGVEAEGCQAGAYAMIPLELVAGLSEEEVHNLVVVLG